MSKEMDWNHMEFATLAVHAGQEPDPMYGSLATPIYQTATFCFDTMDEGLQVMRKEVPGYCYTRGSNPTTGALEKKIAVLEGGEACVVTASGMGAIGAVLLAFLHPGDHVISGGCVYGGTSNVMREIHPSLGIEVTFVDTSDLKAVEAAITERTKMIYFECPTNPTVRLTDIEAISALAHAKGIKVVVDNTFAPPPVQQPLKWGADLVVHSCTKYINGHGDVICGAAIGNRQDIAMVRGKVVRICGATPSPLSSFLVLRGLQTLEIRMERHCSNSLAIAEYLEQVPYVSKVFYPGLKSDPQHTLAEKQFGGMFGGMISFEIKEGINGMDALTACKKFVDQLKIAKIAVSLGDPGTLIEHPVTMTHSKVPKEMRDEMEITDGLLRLSVGLESAKDLIADFAQAFEALG